MEENSVHLLKNGRTLGSRYVIEGVLGEGGFGITYRGHDKTLDVEVAIKEYYPQGFVTRNTTYSEELTVSQSKYTEMFQKGKEKFLSEARTLARFNRQEGVVSVTDFFETNNTAYIVMEFLDGITLKQYIDTQGLLTPAEILDLMAPLMEALDEVHNVGLIHRDISPDNIMLLENGGVKLMDFGAARAYTEFGEKSLSIVLKHGYAPEEQYRTHGVQGPWTDIYALCATMYKCITGITPVESLQRMQGDTLQRPSQLGIPIPPWVEYALMKGMAVFQRDRYQSIAEFCDDLYGDGSNINYDAVASPNQTVYDPNVYANASYNQNGYSQGSNSNYSQNYSQNGYNQSPYNPNADYSQNYGTQNNNKSNNAVIGILMATILILIIGIGMFIWRMNANNASQDAKVTQADQKAAATTQKMTQATTEATTEEVTEATTEAAAEPAFPYTDNEVMDVSACQTADDFYEYSAPDFTFIYPKYVFNYCEANDEENSYYFSSADSSMTLEFYEEDTSGSAKENVKKFYNKTQNEVHAIKYDPKWEDHQVIAGQYVANTNEAFYYFIRNENAKNYIFKFHYVDPDLNNDYNQEDYIMETIYRGCSFSKASKPRSFRNFEDEGKKQ